MASEESAGLFRDLVDWSRRKYNPAHPVEIVALWTGGDGVRIAYRSWFFRDDVHAHTRGGWGDRDTGLWVSLLAEPGPPGYLDPATGLHWDEPVPPEPTPPAVAEAVARAMERPWMPAPDADSLPAPVIDLS